MSPREFRTAAVVMRLRPSIIAMDCGLGGECITQRLRFEPGRWDVWLGGCQDLEIYIKQRCCV